MAAQAALIAETIVGMKRALRRETEYSAPDDPITQPTNRGNKLRANAKYVREGALGFAHPEDSYKQKIEHAGYTRYILQHNPVRYDSEGDELDEDDEDSEADAVAAEENPFSEIALENLLCPLKHPSELPTHPSLSHAYTSKALRNMTKAVEAKLRQERVLLWHARNLHRRFLGDGSWMPCGMFETPEDRLLFEPWASYAMRGSQLAGSGPNGAGTPAATGNIQEKSKQESVVAHVAEKDVEMTDIQNHEMQKGAETPNTHITQPSDQTMRPKSEEFDASVEDLPAHSESNGHTATAAKQDEDHLATSDQPSIGGENGKMKSHDEKGAESQQQGQNQGDEMDKDTQMQDGSSPEPPRRMTTRAQTNAANPNPDQDIDSPSDSATDIFSALPTPHPLFLVPDSIYPDGSFGLPPNEAEETRRVLWSFIQKQEETVRGFEHMLECLLRACRMQEDVFEWCKAEGHAGELSDGEDWYDGEKWGLAEGEELKKGVDEDEIEPVEESRTTGKRGRGRRA
ncbi:RXT2 domain-containing protein [Aspergillus clavatus NRRL 1]|uniref:Transcriptional regulatory protein RXT2 N-terminal domain-containing protein n=1 Tax=Aspergillus clavatus (strain ATCC 1007 / CBS 513.65 / DSM 816 / NCTC 3887 / NRRL 1 / QM 1276 / 107) TaxID=344612 RepID=A1CQK3_ASPCL|nr:uncharacterized protein ACLA_026410 [Aspergillus clavatus NRRL 1]EAW07924.1 conserved hypothetical protein [Aspergillus clavatus NRRL 1]